MATYDQVVDDIMVTMGFTHDDRLRNKEAVLYNVKIAVDKLKKQILAKGDAMGDHRRGSEMLSTYIVEVFHNDAPDNSVTDWDYSYFDLPTSVFSLDHDSGINFIRYLRNEIPCGCTPAVARNPFTGTTIASVHALYGSVYQRPRPENPYYARASVNTQNGTKDRVYLFGIPCDLKHLLIGLYAVTPFDDIDPDDDTGLPDEMLETLKKMVIDLERWAVMMPQERLKNDGRDFEPNQQVRTERTMSVNSPTQIDA